MKCCLYIIHIFVILYYIHVRYHTRNGVKDVALSDLVECPGKKHCVRRMWRGQISRVAGYEEDSGDEELPVGYCTVSWLGEKLHQSQPQQIKATFQLSRRRKAPKSHGKRREN